MRVQRKSTHRRVAHQKMILQLFVYVSECVQMISVLCKRKGPVVERDKLVKPGRESEVKRIMEFALHDEVSDDLTNGKSIWNRAWPDSKEKSRVTRSARAKNKVSGSCQCDDEFAGNRKIMRKDETNLDEQHLSQQFIATQWKIVWYSDWVRENIVTWWWNSCRCDEQRTTLNLWKND